jgi:hypothetical protein
VATVVEGRAVATGQFDGDDLVISGSLVLALAFKLLALVVLVLDTFWPGPFRDWPLLPNLHRK